jgi:gluconate kinase
MPASLLASQLETLEPLQPDEHGLVVSGELSPDQIADDVEARFQLTRSSRQRHDGQPRR